MNIHSYTGLPYNFRNYNCWTHVRNVRTDAGLDTPEFDCASPAEIDAAFDAGHANPAGLKRVYKLQNLDAVLMATTYRGRLVWHAGVYFDGMVSHCERAARQVRLEPISAIIEQYERIEFWR